MMGTGTDDGDWDEWFDRERGGMIGPGQGTCWGQDNGNWKEVPVGDDENQDKEAAEDVEVGTGMRHCQGQRQGDHNKEPSGAQHGATATRPWRWGQSRSLSPSALHPKPQQWRRVGGLCAGLPPKPRRRRCRSAPAGPGTPRAGARGAAGSVPGPHSHERMKGSLSKRH